MNMNAKANVTIDVLKRKIEIDGGLYDLCEAYDTPLREDLREIEVDTENVDFISENDCLPIEGFDGQDFEMLDGFPVAWCYCGGDWEAPVMFALYIGEDGAFHACIPSDGNAYNKGCKSAYGNNDEDPDLVKELWKFDIKKMREEVKARIKLA